MEAKAISKNALRSYPVAQQSGTASSLKVIYGIPSQKALSESTLRQLLVHLYHQVQSTDVFSHRSDSVATMTLTLCGWHRAKGTVQYNGQTITGLVRAITVEGTEYLEVRAKLRELDLDWQ